MQSRNIGCSVHFIPVHLLRYYRERYHFMPDDFPIAMREYERLISLPLSARMCDQDVEDVIDAVTSIVETHGSARPVDVLSA
jgi:dTDP-4-amino-4,6-dideoxygalactose transaminase